MVMMSNSKSIVVACVVAAVTVANLCLSIVAVLQQDSPNKYGLVIGVGIFAIIFFAVGIAIQHHRYKVVDMDDDKIKQSRDHNDKYNS